MKKLKTAVWIFVSISVLYVVLSLALMRGRFIRIHYYAYNTIAQAKKHDGFISDSLEIHMEGDSLQGLEKQLSFWVSKSMYQKFYGFAFHLKKEDTAYRHLTIEKKTEKWFLNNWDLYYKNKLIGDLNSADLDAKIGDTVSIQVIKFMEHKTLGTIQVVIP